MHRAAVVLSSQYLEVDVMMFNNIIINCFTFDFEIWDEWMGGTIIIIRVKLYNIIEE